MKLKIIGSLIMVLLFVGYGVLVPRYISSRTPTSYPTIGQNCRLEQHGDMYYWLDSGKAADFRLRVCADMHIAPPTDQEKSTTDTDGHPIPLFNSAGVEIIDGEDHTWASFHGPHAKESAIAWAESQEWVDRRDGRFDKKASK